MITISTIMKAPSDIIKEMGLDSRGVVKQYIDNRALQKCEPYIPKDTGTLIASGYTGGGYIGWTAHYAKKQYYTNKGTGLRGAMWFNRMWADNGAEIINGARGLVSDSKKGSGIFKDVSTIKKKLLLR